MIFPPSSHAAQREKWRRPAGLETRPAKAKFTAFAGLVIPGDKGTTGAEFVAACFPVRHAVDLGRRDARPPPAPAKT